MVRIQLWRFTDPLTGWRRLGSNTHMANKRRILLFDDERNITDAPKRGLRDWTIERSLDIITARQPGWASPYWNGNPPKPSVQYPTSRRPGCSGQISSSSSKRRHPEILSLLLSVHSEANAIIKIEQAGISSFILKPRAGSSMLTTFFAGVLDLRTGRFRYAGRDNPFVLRGNMAAELPVPGSATGSEPYDVNAGIQGRSWSP